MNCPKVFIAPAAETISGAETLNRSPLLHPHSMNAIVFDLETGHFVPGQAISARLFDDRYNSFGQLRCAPTGT